MDKVTVFIIINALWWLSGVFFGMGIEEKLFEPMRRNRQAKKSECCSPKPLPMQKVEANDSPDDFCCPVAFVVTADDEHPSTGRVVVRDIDSVEPVGYSLCDARSNAHSSTPNVKLTGSALLRSPG